MNTASNTTSNAIAALPPGVADWCGNYAGFSLAMAKAFLIIALIVALVETVVVLLPKIRAAFEAPAAAKVLTESVVPAVDPVKLLEALKGVLEALKGLPAWIAIFLAGLALLWMAGQKPEICAPAGPSREGREAGGNRSVTQNTNAGNQIGQSQGNQARPETNTVR
ncbi:MAG TPA: hypothetical protein VIT38_02060 [Allosphingosinicella sp.]